MSDEQDRSDEELFLPDALAIRTKHSKALIQYSIDAGCPTVDGRLSYTMLILWMLDNYGRLRQLAGLAPLPSREGGNPEQKAREKVANMTITFADFLNSRASNPTVKQATAEISKILRDRQAGD